MLDPNQVIFSLSAKERTACIRELAGCVRAPDFVQRREEIVATAVSRERSMSSGFGQGIAVPHARVPGIERVQLAFGRATTGIDWQAPDMAPVSLVFFVVTAPEQSDHHLEMMAAIGRAMSKTNAREQLLEAGDQAELCARLMRLWADH